MFGYVQVRKPELKIKDYGTYHAFYCGLCERLRARYGLFGQLTLTYDMTFMIIVLSSVYDAKCVMEKKRCIVHPAKKHNIIYNEFTDYCADMNIVLSYYHCLDDKEDDASLKGKVGASIFKAKSKHVQEIYKRQSEAVKNSLAKLSEYEKNECYNAMKAADCFGSLLAELFMLREDAFKVYLGDLGYYLGRYIYIMDAYDDIEEDIKKNRYNPFKHIYKEEDFEKYVYDMLLNEISMACGAFEQLPCIDYIDILRNILYAGVWNRYDKINAPEEEELK